MARVSSWCFTIVLLSLLAMLTACISPSTPTSTPLPTPSPAPEPFPANARVFRPGETLPANLGGYKVPTSVYPKDRRYVHQGLDFENRLCAVEEGESLTVEAFVDRPNSTLRILIRKAACVGYLSESEVRIPGVWEPDGSSGDDICAYARAAGEALVEMQGTFADARSHLKDRAWLRRAAQTTRSQSNTFGAMRQPAGTDDLQVWTVGAIVAASKVLDEWAAGGAGEDDSSIYLRLLDAAVGEVNRIRRERSCW